MERLLDKQAAAELLSITERHLTFLVEKRRIPFVRVGGRTIRFRASDLAEWLEARHVEAVN